MKTRFSELVDRYTILELKYAHGLEDTMEEMEDLEPHIRHISQWHVNELRDINAKMWETERQIGKMYLKLKKYTMQRAAAKNKITKEYGGYTEYKQY